MKPVKKSARKQSRYQRNDVTAVLKQSGFFGNRIHPTQIVDISTEGIAVYTNQQLKRNAHVHVILGFMDGQRFTLKGRIAHIFSSEDDDTSDINVEMLIGNSLKLVTLPFKYGIKFEDIPSLYSDYLIESGLQKKLGGLSIGPQTALADNPDK